MAKFFRRGTSIMKFAPAVAGVSPTRAEITASTDLSAQVTALSGWQFSNKRIATPILSSSYTLQIDGPDEVGDSSLTFLDDNSGTTARTTLAKGTSGFILIFPYGDVPTKRCEVWPVKSTGANDEWSLGSDPARYQVDFAVTLPPTQNAVIPV